MERDHAIVVGASMGGLLAARVLSEHFGHVTILERDPLPSGPEVRKSVPQGAHVHVLLEGGRRILFGLFPDLCDALRAAGAVETEVGSRFAWHQFGVWKTRSPLTPPARRGGLLFAIENGRWMCTLSGWLRDYPPTDEADFISFARDLAVPDLYEVIRGAEPLGEIRPHRFASSMRRRFERLRGMPEGFVVMGDALSSFNPVYGQGMTVSAMEADALDACLRDIADGQVTAQFQRRAARIVDAAWLLAATEDLRHPEVEGARPPLLHALHAYVERAHRVAARDEIVMKRLCEVLSMSATPSSLFGLATAVRVLGRSTIRGRQPGREPAHV